MTFKPSFADWQSLFANIVPAHIARTVGWNTGFTGPAQVISGSWFKIQSFNADQSVVLTRNPKYWSTPAKLNKLVFQFFSDDKQLVPALQNKEIDIFNPSTANLSIVQTANQVPNTTKATLPGLEFEHIDFNQADPYLAKVGVREAIAHGVNRQSIIARTVGQIAKGTSPLGSRMLVPSQKGYQATSFAFDPGQSVLLLKKLGFKKAADGYFHPNFGPQKGKDLTFTMQSTAGNTIRSQTEVLFQAQMKAIGIRINIQNYDAQHLRQQPAQRGLPDRRIRLVQHALRLGEPAHLLLLHQRQRVRLQLDPFGQRPGGRIDEPGLGRDQQFQGDQRLQQRRRHSVADHGHVAAVPGPAVLRLVQQPEGRPAEHVERRRHLERRGLEHQLLIGPSVGAGSGRDRLGEMEHVVGVVLPLDLLQAGQIGSVVGLLPVGQGGVDVVLVGALARRREGLLQMVEPVGGRRLLALRRRARPDT